MAPGNVANIGPLQNMHSVLKKLWHTQNVSQAHIDTKLASKHSMLMWCTGCYCATMWAYQTGTCISHDSQAKSRSCPGCAFILTWPSAEANSLNLSLCNSSWAKKARSSKKYLLGIALMSRLWVARWCIVHGCGTCHDRGRGISALTIK